MRDIDGNFCDGNGKLLPQTGEEYRDMLNSDHAPTAKLPDLTVSFGAQGEAWIATNMPSVIQAAPVRVAKYVPDSRAANLESELAIARDLIATMRARIEELEAKSTDLEWLCEARTRCGNGLYQAVAKVVHRNHPDPENERDSEWDVLPQGVQYVIDVQRHRAEAAEAQLSEKDTRIDELGARIRAILGGK